MAIIVLSKGVVACAVANLIVLIAFVVSPFKLKAQPLQIKASLSFLLRNKNDKEALICKGRALSLKGDTTNAISTIKLATAQATTPLDKTIIAILSGNAYKK